MDTLEEISKIAQKYIAERPLIVLGTGATIPFGLPSMTTLSNELISEIHIKNTDPDYSTWKRFEKELGITKDLELSLHKVEMTESLLSAIIYKTWELVNKKDLELYYRLLEEPAINYLAQFLKFLLCTANPQLNIITTNYDRFAEYSAELAESNTYLGFTQGLMGRFVADLTEKVNINFPKRIGQINIMKVHGSLDWFYDQNDTTISIPLANKIPENYVPSIVTPGISKYRKTHDDPFRTIMAMADKAITSANSFLCIGYGFNDEHVQPKLVKMLKDRNIPIVVIAKQLTDSARRILLNGTIKKYLLIEESGRNNSNIYLPTQKDPIEFKNSSLWQLDQFNSLIMNEEK